MNIKEQLMAELKSAMQERNELKKDTITMLRAAILQVEKDGQKELSGQEILGIVAKEIKKRRESIPDFEKGNRQDIIDKLKEEITILQKYLPEQLSEEEIRKLVLDAIENTKAESLRDMGKVMQAVKDKTTGVADGKVVSDIVKEELAKI